MTIVTSGFHSGLLSPLQRRTAMATWILRNVNSIQIAKVWVIINHAQSGNIHLCLTVLIYVAVLSKQALLPVPVNAGVAITGNLINSQICITNIARVRRTSTGRTRARKRSTFEGKDKHISRVHWQRDRTSRACFACCVRLARNKTITNLQLEPFGPWTLHSLNCAIRSRQRQQTVSPDWSAGCVPEDHRSQRTVNDNEWREMIHGGRGSDNRTPYGDARQHSQKVSNIGGNKSSEAVTLPTLPGRRHNSNTGDSSAMMSQSSIFQWRFN